MDEAGAVQAGDAEVQAVALAAAQAVASAGPEALAVAARAAALAAGPEAREEQGAVAEG